jgi:hypothetical protein
MLQQAPIIVEVAKQPTITPDISVSVVVGMFQMAGAFLLVAAIGSLIAGGIAIVIRRRRDASSDGTPDTGHVRLRI